MISIYRPIITEKSIADAQRGVFTFEVSKNVSKSEVKKSVEKLFNVHVKSVQTVKRKGKKRYAGRKRKIVYEPDGKKAKVKLAAGEKIDLFDIGGKK